MNLCVALAGLRLPTSPRPRVPSWVPELEDDDPDDIPTHVRDLKMPLLNPHVFK